MSHSLQNTQQTQNILPCSADMEQVGIAVMA